MAKKPEERVDGRKRYETLKNDRNEVLRQAREASRLTIPGLVPEEGSSDPHAVSEQPYTSAGSRFVNNLSAKLLVALFPPERPFFRLDIGADVAAEMGAELEEAQAALWDISRRAMILADESSSRTIWMEALRHLVVAGNVMVHQPDDGSQMRLWRLDQFVATRGRDGLVQEGVMVDKVLPSELKEEVIEACGIDYDPEDPKTNKKIDIYTHVYTDGDKMHHYESINDKEVPGSRGSSARDKTGWQFLRWQAIPGSDYGRSHVAEYAGDFLSLADASRSILMFAVEAARIVRIVDPNSGIDVEELASAESGDFLTGMRDRISTLQLDKNSDFSIVWDLAQSIERRLSQAFLIASNAIRDAERVTAEEIKAISQELEDSLGGTYTVLSSEVQRPYARRLLHILSRKKEAPELPEEVNVVIVTGFNALGANHEVATLRDWLFDMKDIFGPAWMENNLDGPKIAARMGIGRGVVDIMDLLKDPQVAAQEQQQAQLAEAGQKMAPNLAKGVMDMAAQGQPPTPPAP